MNFSSGARVIRVLAIRTPSQSVRISAARSIQSGVPKALSTRSVSSLQFAAAAALNKSPISAPSFLNSNAPSRTLHSSAPSLSSASESSATTAGTGESASETNSSSGTSSASAQGASNSEEDVGKIKKSLAERDKQVAELQDAYRRLLADMENLRNRTAKEKAAASTYAIQKFASDLLESVDVLKIALNSVPEDARKTSEPLENLYTGVTMTRVELLKALKRHGVEEFDPIGEKFDPLFHQALFQAESEDMEPGKISAVMKTGWMLNDRVLRPASVGVVKEKS
ncbi:Mitochondrial matrix cochaperone [Nowakowskiella sp. JEL0407]|nr:Mitochondrial matrix cochaperone [Nowakowskiella sp. JEL0407]